MIEIERQYVDVLVAVEPETDNEEARRGGSLQVQPFRPATSPALSSGVNLPADQVT